MHAIGKPLIWDKWRKYFYWGTYLGKASKKIHREVWPFAKPPLTQHNKDQYNGNEDNDNKESFWTKFNKKICNKNV